MKILKELLQLHEINQPRSEFSEPLPGYKAQKPIWYDTVYIASDYLAALINGDTSGIDDEDERLIDEWYENIKKQTNGDSLTFIPKTEHPEMDIDDITGKQADCIEVDIFYYE